ncbi:MAG: YHS domain-containing protein, partial [Gemmataceae bacterium]
WKGTGQIDGGDLQKDFWVENVSWEWQFKKDDCWISVQFNRGKYYTDGILRYLPEHDKYQLALNTVDKKKEVFEGSLTKNVLTLEREDERNQDTQKLVISMLHETRFLYHLEVKPKEKTTFKRVYRVGATRAGIKFAAGDGKPECIVSGGLGTSTVTYQGKTYYVCCSGCRDAFNENPEKFIKEFEAKQKEK